MNNLRLGDGLWRTPAKGSVEDPELSAAGPAEIGLSPSPNSVAATLIRLRLRQSQHLKSLIAVLRLRSSATGTDLCTRGMQRHQTRRHQNDDYYCH